MSINDSVAFKTVVIGQTGSINSQYVGSLKRIGPKLKSKIEPQFHTDYLHMSKTVPQV